MNINLEANTQNTVQAYQDNKIQINSIGYESSLIVSAQEIIRDLAINRIQDIDDQYLDLLTQSKPEIIIIGHEQTGVFPSGAIRGYLSQQRIGLECMSVGAACRTFNVLLSELRKVVLCIII